MAGAEDKKADVGEGRMAASEGANGGEYADEGQDRRGGKKNFLEPVRFHAPFCEGLLWSWRIKREKISL